VRVAVYVGRLLSALFDVHIQLTETVAAETQNNIILESSYIGRITRPARPSVCPSVPFTSSST